MRKKKLRFFYFIILVSVLFVLSKYGPASFIEKKQSDPKSNLDLSYFTILSKESSVESSIKEVYVRTGEIYIVTYSQDSISIVFDVRNIAYDPPYLSSHVAIGDFLSKKAGSDTLTVLKKGGEYKFLLRNYVPK